MEDVVDNITLEQIQHGTFVNLINFADMDSELARIAQLTILDLLDTTLSSDINNVAGDASSWSDEQVAEAYAAISMTVNALKDLAINQEVPLVDLSGTVTQLYNNWVGPTEIRLIDETGLQHARDDYGETQWHWNEDESERIIGHRQNHAAFGSDRDVLFDTIWRGDADHDDNLILLPHDFGHRLPMQAGKPIYGEELGRWLLAGELGLAINNRAFGLMTHNLTSMGIHTNDETTSGRDNTFLLGRPWVYDEQGIFDFSDIGGPNGSNRYNYSNETPEDEIRDMFKQWVFLNHFIYKNHIQTSEDLTLAIRDSQGFLTLEPNPNMTEARAYDAQQILGVANMLGIELSDEERAYYRQWSRGHNVTEIGGDHNPFNTERTLEIEAALQAELGNAIPAHIASSVQYYIHTYNSIEKPQIDTFFERHNFMDIWLEQAYVTSQVWRDAELQATMLDDFIIAHNHIINADQTDNPRLFWHSQANNQVNRVIMDYEFAAHDLLNQASGTEIDLRNNYQNASPTDYYNMYALQRDTAFRLLNMTDWANPYNQDGSRYTYRLNVNTESPAQIEVIYPPSIRLQSAGNLSQLWQSDLSKVNLDILTLAINGYDRLYGHNYPTGFDPMGYPVGGDNATVTNYNAQFLFGSALLAASLLSEPLDLLMGGTESVNMLLSGNIAGAAINAGVTFIPGAWGQLRRLGNRALDLTRHGLSNVSQYVDDLVRGSNQILAGASSAPTYFPNAIITRRVDPATDALLELNDPHAYAQIQAARNQLRGNSLYDQLYFSGGAVNSCVPTSCAMIIDTVNAQRVTLGINNRFRTLSYNDIVRYINDGSGFDSIMGADIIDVGLPITVGTRTQIQTSRIIQPDDLLIHSQKGPILLEIFTDANQSSRHVIVIDAVGKIDDIMSVSVRDSNGYEYIVSLDELSALMTGRGAYFPTSIIDQ